MSAETCDTCGYALNVSRVLLLVNGRAMNDHRLCRHHLSAVFDALEGKGEKQS